MDCKPLTCIAVQKRKHQGQKLVMVTAYDVTFAQLLSRAGADILLVGDSLGMVVQGAPHTLGVTLNQMIYHSRCVSRSSGAAQVVADMPFLTYHVSHARSVRAAGALLQRGGAHAVKLEGGARQAPVVRRIVDAGIPVMGHIGLTPQRLHEQGGFVVQGKSPGAAQRLLDDAHALCAAGIYALVLEGLPSAVAARITEAVAVPTIGIGAGPHCDGQVLVSTDLLGLGEGHSPKFVRRFADLGEAVRRGMQSFAEAVRDGSYPQREHTYAESPAAKARAS